jgi:hypothetical protein
MFAIIEDENLASLKGGEPITLTLVIAVAVLSLVCVSLFKLYQSYKGKLGLPGGFSLEWQV